MVEPTRRVERDEFETVSRTLVSRAKTGTAHIARVAVDDAEDVVQDAWEKELRKNSPLPRGNRLLGHIGKALADTSIDHRRRQQRKKEFPPETRVSFEALEGVVGGDAEEQALAALQARELYEVTKARLDPQAVKLAILSTLQFEEHEAAELLGLTDLEAGAARTRVRRARSDIAEAISHQLDPKGNDPKEAH
jgi:DNA-directed RNA polymerase specialized sigma24 family protein